MIAHGRRIGSGNDLAIDAAFSVSVIDLERLSWLPAAARLEDMAPEPPDAGRVRTPTRAGPRTSRVFALFTMSVAAISRSDRKAHRSEPANQIASGGWWSQSPPKERNQGLRRRNQRRLVEPTGIEPVTSCLQSTRSPS
jgi:hypothetical protein